LRPSDTRMRLRFDEKEVGYVSLLFLKSGCSSVDLKL
jgi:hypothetical protein